MFQSSIAPKDDRNAIVARLWLSRTGVPILDRPEGRPQPSQVLQTAQSQAVPILDRPEGRPQRLEPI